MMRMRSLLIMFILLVLLAVGAPALAQELVTNTPVVEVVATTEPAPVQDESPAEESVGLVLSTIREVLPWLVAIVLVVLLMALILGRTAIIQLGASVPAFVYEAGKGALLASVEQAERHVELTATTIDDEALNELKVQISSLIKQIEELRAQVTPTVFPQG